MPVSAVPEAYSELVDRIRRVAASTEAMASSLRLLFVTNLRSDEFTDLGPEGVLNSAQYYTRREADAMVRSFQDLGLTVEPLYSEIDLIEKLTEEMGSSDDRPRIVYTTAEGGSGPGRRALIPALCNLLGLPILNSGAHASTLMRHKYHAYTVLREVGIRVPNTWQFDRGGWKGGRSPELGVKVIVKPTYESMGIGVGEDSVQIVGPDFDSFIAEKNRRFGQAAVAQEFISGEEVGVPVAGIGGPYALPPVIQRRANGELFDQRPKTFRDEHLDHDLSYAHFEAPEPQMAALREAAVRTYDALDMKGVGRIDFRVDRDGRAWVFDTNGEPPPLAPTCWSEAMERLGFSLREMLALWVGICLHDYGLTQDSTQNESSQQGNSRP